MLSLGKKPDCEKAELVLGGCEANCRHEPSRWCADMVRTMAGKRVVLGSPQASGFGAVVAFTALNGIKSVVSETFSFGKAVTATSVSL